MLCDLLVRRARLSCWAIILGCSVAVWSVDQATAKPPNVLFIMTDQQHADMLSCTGNPNLSTPALDALASGGIRFDHGYVTNPVCVPSRISMATGMMAGRFGVFHNQQRAILPDVVTENSLGKLLKNAGYDTFYGGKTHLPPELEPAEAGYDEYFRDDREMLPRACVEFITRERDKPFFAVASFINPHDICYAYKAYKGEPPVKKASVNHLYAQAAALPEDQLPPLPPNYPIPFGEPDAIEMFSNPNSVTPSGIMREVYDEREWRIYRWIYCRLTEQVDGHIGVILDALARHGLEEDTLVIFTSDHGDMDSCHRLASKGRFYENSVRVPFLVRYPSKIPAGQVDSEHLMSTGLDILPTICDYAGISIPAFVQGRSVRSLAEEGQDEGWRSFVVSENQTGRMVRSQHFKYCIYTEGENRESLVDLRNDPGELTNLANAPESQATVNEYRRLLEDWVAQSNDQAAKAFMIPAP